MPARRSTLRTASGKLIPAIQKEWGRELGTSASEESEKMMNRCHKLLNAPDSHEMQKILAGRSIEQYVGLTWVANHPSVKNCLANLAEAIRAESKNESAT